MAAATTAPIFPMTEHLQFDYFGFDPQLDYAQALAETQKNQQLEVKTTSAADRAPRTARRPDVVGDISCFSGHFRPAAEVFKPAAAVEDMKTCRKSWKSSLLFWRKSQKKNNHKSQCSGILTPQHPGFKSRCKPLPSGPIYMNDVHVGSSYGRSGRATMSGPLAAILKRETQIPYMPLHLHSSRPALARPIYLVT